MKKWNRLIIWIKQNGGHVDNIIMDNNRIIKTQRNIPINTEIIKIPNHLHINGKSSHFHHDNMVSTMAHFITEYQKGKKSFFYPYISILPKKFDDHPINFINNSNIRDFIKISTDFVYYIIELQKKYKYCQQELIKLGFHEKNMMYTFLLIQTRAWITNDHISLIPVIDLLQHKNENTCLGLIKDNNFIMSTNDEYKSGDQIYDSYGFKDDLMLLSQYNFISDDPILPIDIDQSSDIIKYIFSKIYDFYKSYPYISNNGPNLCLLSCFRVINTPIELLRKLPFHHFIQPSNMEIENKSMKLLRQTLESSLSKIQNIDTNINTTDNRLIKLLKYAIDRKKNILIKNIFKYSSSI